MRSLRHAPVSFSFPQDLPRGPLNAVNHPAMKVGRRRHTVATEIESLRRCFCFALAHDGRDKDPITPDDRRRPAVTGNVPLPNNVLRGAPGFRESFALSHAHRILAPKLRPVVI